MYTIYMKLPILSILIVTLIIPLQSDAQITKNLRLGDVGPEVKELQKFLNQDFRTVIAQNGLGSRNQETEYFGVLTQNAVIRFQELYKNDVLTPAGLLRGTGVVGQYTRSKIQSLTNQGKQQSTNDVSLSNQVPPLPIVAEEKNSLISLLFAVKPKLFALSRYRALPGETIEIHGLGFEAKGNSVFFGEREVLNQVSDGASIFVTVPNDLANGSYNVWVKNSKGSTFDAKFGNYFTVSDTAALLPVIQSALPQKISLSANQVLVKVTLSGSTDGVTLTTTLGEVLQVTWVNNEAEINVSSLSGYSDVKKNLSQTDNGEVPLYIYAKNSAGFSDNPGVVYLVK